MTKKQFCRDCKHLERDGMFGIFCGVGGNNTKYDCQKYEKRSDRMTENKQFIEPNKECRVIKNTKTGEIATYYDTEDGLIFLKWLNNLSNENEKLKQSKKGQELEIVRLHHLADAMSGVLRELGIYDVYNKEQIDKVKKRVEGNNRMIL